MKKLITLVVLANVLFAGGVVHAELTDEEIGAAIDRMQKWLFKQQQADGGFEKPGAQKKPKPGAKLGHGTGKINGDSVMATYGLINSGVPVQDPRIVKAIKYLRKYGVHGTYAYGIRCHIWSALPDEFLPLLEDDVMWLLQAQNGGLWDYGDYRKTRVDHSVSQYGSLGLWEGAKRGLKIPNGVWKEMYDHYISVQGADGGWSYGANGESRGSMTAAGLTVLYVVQQELFRGKKTPDPKITKSIDRGLEWFDKNFTAKRNPGHGGWVYYYLYGMERVALAGGIRKFKGQDWFEAGATQILRAERGKGNVSKIVQTSFALGFLARGRVPVWASKLWTPGQTWNNLPNDLYFLSKYLSDLREHELNWQVVRADENSREWLNSPVLYISSNQPLKLTDKQVDNLRQYVEMGGLILANPEQNSSGFKTSMEQLALKLFDQRPKAIARDHALLTLVRPANSGGRANILAVNNGVRDLMIMPTTDWGYTWQSDRKPGEGPAWDFATNLYAMVTDRGVLTNRLVDTIEPRKSDAKIRDNIVVVRPEYDGQWNPEPRAFEPLSNELVNRAGLDITMARLPLDQIGKGTVVKPEGYYMKEAEEDRKPADQAKADDEVDAESEDDKQEVLEIDVVHLAGVDPIELTDEQKNAIKAFVDAGGTVLVETVGGRGEFAVEIEKQLRSVFGDAAGRMAPFDPVLTGQGLTGGTNARRVLYRSFAVLNMAARTSPRLAAIMVDNRPAVIISAEDLSLGSLGVRHWGINGYQVQSARDILGNILLTAHKLRNARTALAE